MVRIKGANSDYRYDLDSGGIQEVFPQPSPVHLNLYICPYDMPSPVEAPTPEGWCEGQDATCPHPDETSGHALVQLHQDNGIALVTDGSNQLVIDQAGRILLEPARGQVIIGKPESTRLSLNQTAQGWDIQLPDGPQIHLNRDGSLHLIAGQSGKVQVQGTLQVEADLDVAGDLSCQNLTVKGTTDALLAAKIAHLESRLQQLEALQQTPLTP